MRFRTSMSVILCVFAVGLGVVGCSSGGSSSTSSGTATDSPTNSASSASASASTQQSQAAASGGLCQPSNLSFTLGAKTGGTSQTTQVVDLTNKGSSACTMEGFPGVNLVGRRTVTRTTPGR